MKHLLFLSLLLLSFVGYSQTTIVLKADTNSVFIGTFEHPKNTLRAKFADSNLTIYGTDNTLFVDKKYTSFVNSETGLPFASYEDLKAWVRKNFFGDAPGSGGAATVVNGKPGPNITLTASDIKTSDSSTIQEALDTKVTTPVPLIPGVVLGTTLSTNTLSMVAYYQRPMGDGLAMYTFGGQLKVADPVDSNDATSKKFVESYALPVTEKGAANGTASLGPDGKVPSSQLNVSGGFNYLGSWDAATNTPPLSDTVGNNGDMYKVGVAGIRDLGSGVDTFNEGDHIVYVSGENKWDKYGASEAVASVNGKTGAVVINKTDVGLANVDNTSDVNKPISTATQTALNTKVNKAGDVMSGELKVVFPTASKKAILAMSDPGAAHTADGTLGATSTYLQIGGGEWGSGSYRLIGFGYLTPETNHSPAFVGYQETSTTTNTRGDLIFGTRPNNNNVAPNVVMRINSAGQILVEDTTYKPTANNSLVNKKYVDSSIAGVSGGSGGGVPQTSSPNRTYVTTSTGQQSYISYTNTYAEGGAMVQYTSAGNVFVSDPTDPAHATPKSYVDNAVQNAVAGGYTVARQDSPFIKSGSSTSETDMSIPLPQREANFWATYEIMVSSVMDSASHIKLVFPSPGAGITIKGTASIQGSDTVQNVLIDTPFIFPTDGYPKTITISLYVDCFPEGVTWGSLKLSAGTSTVSDPPIELYEASKVTYREIGL